MPPARLTPAPLGTAALREEWQALRQDAQRLQPQSLPSPAAVAHVWRRLRVEAEQQDRSVFETSSMLAVSAIRATRTGQIVGDALLAHYRSTLEEIRQTG